MGSCNKIPRTNSNEEFKANGGNRNAPVAISSLNPANRHPQPTYNQNYPPQPIYQNQRPLPYIASPAPQNSGNPNYYPSYPGQQSGPSHPISHGYRPHNQSYNPAPNVPNNSSVQSIPLSGGRLADPNPVISQTKSVSRYCRIIEEKVTLVPADNNLHYVDFEYKCKFPANLTIYYFVREGFDSRDQKIFFYADIKTQPKAMSFSLTAGDKESFSSRYKTMFSSVNKQLLEVADKCTYPLVIEIECKNPMNPKDIQVLINCYKIIGHNEEFQASVLKQVIKIEGAYKTLSNFYGTSVEREESECLICMTDAKVVALLPCKHVCYCEECVKEVQKKPRSECPVCRTPVNSYLKVNH